MAKRTTALPTAASGRFTPARVPGLPAAAACAWAQPRAGETAEWAYPPSAARRDPAMARPARAYQRLRDRATRDRATPSPPSATVQDCPEATVLLVHTPLL